MQHLLDNPAWSALVSQHSSFSQGIGPARRYRPGILPFAALEADGDFRDLDPLVKVGESLYVIGRLPTLPGHWVLDLELPCAQLLAPEELSVLAPVREQIVLLGEADKTEMFALISSVQPGYYLPDTRQLGDYFGIRQEGRLVAMAGERMRISGFTELSAVCTLPEYTGRGYAQQLMTKLMQGQVAAGIKPFLHVSKANKRALQLYDHLGFVHRRDISFWRVRKISD